VIGAASPLCFGRDDLALFVPEAPGLDLYQLRVERA